MGMARIVVGMSGHYHIYFPEAQPPYYKITLAVSSIELSQLTLKERKIGILIFSYLLIC